MRRAWTELRTPVSVLVLLGLLARLLAPLPALAAVEGAAFDAALRASLCLPSGLPAPDAPNEAPQTADAELEIATGAGLDTAGFEAAWWRQFGDPVLDDLVSRALEGDLDLRLAVARVREARALFRDARLDYVPAVTAHGGYQKQDAPVQGGTQALSRSLFASMIPKHKSSEFFAFFGVFERYAGILGPLVFAVMVEATGQSRNAILAVLGFFIIGGALLAFVKVEEGRAAARKAEVVVS